MSEWAESEFSGCEDSGATALNSGKLASKYGARLNLLWLILVHTFERWSLHAFWKTLGR